MPPRPRAPRPRPLELWYLGDQHAAFAEALGLAGLDFGSFRFDPAAVALWGGDAYRLPLFNLFFTEPFQISPYTRDLSQGVLRQAGSVSRLTYIAQSNAGVRVRDNYYSSYLSGIVARVEADGDQALARALALMTAEGPSRPPIPDPAAAGVPPVIQTGAAVLLRAIEHAAHLRELGCTGPLGAAGFDLDAVYADLYRQLFWDTRADDDDNPDPAVELAMIGEMLQQEQVLAAVDFPVLYKGANLIALALDHVRAEIDSLPAEERSRLGAARFEYACATPLGWVRLNGAGDHSYGPHALLPGQALRRRPDDEHDLLILDTAGNDIYRQAGATTSPRRGIGVALDLTGDDHYASPDAAGWEAYNARVEGRSGNFVHHVPGDHTAAFGAGILGYGFLVDLAGQDRYATPFGGQGCGLLGQGVLLDASGDDRYTGDTGVQGSGTFGVGALADLAGDDEFHCYHRSQGYAYTLGAGILVDAGGEDAYIGETENVKYRWFGTHSEQLNMSGGFGYGRRADMSDGHSWAGGVGMLVDGGGENDCYYCNDSAFGAGNVNGLAVCWDRAGDDLYVARSNSFGQPFVESSGSRRDFILNAGLFLDAGGKDDYRQLPEDVDAAAHEPFDFGDGTQFPRIEWLGDGARRSWRGHLEQPLSTGAALDLE